MGEVRRDDEKTEERRREAAIRRAASTFSLSFSGRKHLRTCVYINNSIVSKLFKWSILSKTEEKERAEQDKQARTGSSPERNDISAESLTNYYFSESLYERVDVSFEIVDRT